MTVVSSRGCLGLKDERRFRDRLITGQEDSPPRSCRRRCTPFVVDLQLDGQSARKCRLYDLISRAIAVVTMTFAFLIAPSRR
jgi:hypothetical protein